MALAGLLCLLPPDGDATPHAWLDTKTGSSFLMVTLCADHSAGLVLLPQRLELLNGLLLCELHRLLPTRPGPACRCWPGCDCTRGVLAASVHSALPAGAGAEGGDV